MKLTVFNGSPRGEGGNTQILLNHFLAGFTDGGAGQAEVIYLKRSLSADEACRIFREAEAVLVAFPLYTDCMPAIVKEFIEGLQPLRRRPGQAGRPPILFLVQSGFIEAIHSRAVEMVLQKLAARLSSPYLGTIIKGNCEGLRVMPPNVNRRLFARMRRLGEGLQRNGCLDPQLLRELARPEKLSPAMRLLFRLLGFTGLANFYWNRKLKRNRVFHLRFDRPFATDG